MARSRIGGPIAATQGVLSNVRHKCPWQVFKNPETGETRLERTYSPDEEPLTETKIVEETLNE
jgi:hypothetical protein